MLNKFCEGLNKTMTDEEMHSFVEAIGRCELYDEFEEIKKMKKLGINKVGGNYPRFLKAIRVALTELGYDAHWVEYNLKDALEEKYFNNLK